MLKIGIILGIFVIILVPFSSYADEVGVVGANLGLDFYSRIDDAGDSLAQGITKRRLMDKGNYGSLGCGATWISGEAINQRFLDDLAMGNTTVLVQLASAHKISLSTETESALRQCLVEKYNNIQKAAHEDQNTLEIVGNVGLYMDGDTANSDYDIISDISHINTIIFKEKYEYTGAKNASANAVADMLAGKPIGPLFHGTGSDTTTASGGTVSGSTGSGTSSSASVDSTLPWAGVCQANGASDSMSAGLFGEGFFDDLGSTLAGGGRGDGLVHTSTGITTGADSGSTSSSRFGLSEKKDFYNSPPPCDGVFCITLDMKGGTQNVLGGFANTSIESLIEQHSKIMEPISWSDLSCNSMSRASFGQLSKGKNFAKEIAGGHIYLSDSPQQTKHFEKEDTPENKDAVFDAAFRCAMNEAGLIGSESDVNGFIGAGFAGVRDTQHVSNKTMPLGPKEMESLAGCYQIRMQAGKSETYKGFSTDLTEIQAFTRSMMGIIDEILQTDKKLDNLPFCN